MTITPTSGIRASVATWLGARPILGPHALGNARVVKVDADAVLVDDVDRGVLGPIVFGGCREEVVKDARKIELSVKREDRVEKRVRSRARVVRHGVNATAPISTARVALVSGGPVGRLRTRG